VDILSSSLNGFSLRVFSCSGLAELDILDARLVRFQGNAGSGGFQNPLDQDLFLIVVVEEVFDRFQFLGRNETWMCK
jgi:hypothetical protein